MHPKVIGTDGWATVRKLAEAGLTEGWTLAGGTALALPVEHRISRDLDFFRPEPFDPEAGRCTISPRWGRVGVQGRAEATLHLTLDRLRVSFLQAQAPLLSSRAHRTGTCCWPTHATSP